MASTEHRHPAATAAGLPGGEGAVAGAGEAAGAPEGGSVRAAGVIAPTLPRADRWCEARRRNYWRSAERGHSVAENDFVVSPVPPIQGSNPACTLVMYHSGRATPRFCASVTNWSSGRSVTSRVGCCRT